MYTRHLTIIIRVCYINRNNSSYTSLFIYNPTSMDRLEQDLRFFKQELEGEKNLFRRQLLTRQILDVELKIHKLLLQEREEAARQHKNLKDALEKKEKSK